MRHFIEKWRKEGKRGGGIEEGREGWLTSRSSSISLGKKTRFVSARLAFSGSDKHQCVRNKREGQDRKTEGGEGGREGGGKRAYCESI